MSLIEEVRKRIQQITKEPILPILRTNTRATPKVWKLPLEMPPEFQVAYTPPRKRR